MTIRRQNLATTLPFITLVAFQVNMQPNDQNNRMGRRAGKTPRRDFSSLYVFKNSKTQQMKAEQTQINCCSEDVFFTF